jgi:O-antigen/teichoic acid export membrane protein
MSVPIQATRRRALGDVVLQIVTRVGNLALGIVVTVLLARALGAAGYGQWVTLLNVFGLLGYFMTFGLSSVAVREAAADPDEAEDWVSAYVTVQLVMAIPVTLAGVGVLVAISEDRTMLLAGLALLAQTPIAIGASLQIVHQLRMDNRVPMALLTLNSVLWCVAVVVVDLLGGGLLALALAMTGTVACTSLLQVVLAVRLQRFHLRPSRHRVVQLVRVGAPLGIAGLLVLGYARIDQVLVYSQLGATEAGEYGAAYRLLDQAHFIPISVMTTVAPLLAALWPANRARLLRVTTMTAELLAMGSFGALAFAIVAATPVMRTLFGDELVGGAPALPLLVGAFVAMCFGYLVDSLLLILGQVPKQVWIALVGLVVNVAGNLLLLPRYGMIAAAWMTLATEVVVCGGGLVVALWALGRPWPSLGRVPLVALAATLMAVVLLAVRQVNDSLAVLALTAVVAYPALLLALRALSPHEVREILLRRAPA